MTVKKPLKRDRITSVRTLDDISRLKGIAGVYVMVHTVTNFIKVGRTFNIVKRQADLSSVLSPHLLIAFYPSDQYDKIEKLFHRHHRVNQIDQEYFYLDLDYVINWIESLGLKSSYSPSLSEIAFQVIRSNWILHNRLNPIAFKDFLKNTLENASR